jgi:prepilin-type N-terminal cleavage/methylation domain-containing protein
MRRILSGRDDRVCCSGSGRGGARSGFTLIELLAGIAIMLLLGTVAGMVFRESLSAWTSGVERNERDRAARAALQLMARDLRNAVADATNRPFSLGADSNFPAIYGMPSDKAWFYTLTQEDGSATNFYRTVQQVSYYVQKCEQSSSNQYAHFQLMRQAEKTDAHPAPTNLTLHGMVAPHVAGLQFQVFPAYFTTNGVALTNDLPPYVDIGLSLLDETAARRAAALTNDLDEQSAFVERHEKRYAVRVYLRNRFERQEPP